MSQLGARDAPHSFPPNTDLCECENPDRGLFIWRGDPAWWACVQCDHRVRPLTEEERRNG